jgi:UTP:GlnB (protein PII) uridylyltransferase
VETAARVHFEENGTELTAVEVGQSSRSPVITRLHRVLFALGVVVSTYQVRTLGNGIVERFVLQRRDGSAVNGELGARTRAAVLPIALHSEG